MYIARLTLNQSRVAMLWQANPYRVHQQLRMAYPAEPRLLFRIEQPEDRGSPTRILVQSQTPPDWSALEGFEILDRPPEHKELTLGFKAAQRLRFRLLANPTYRTRNAQGRSVRLSHNRADAQMAWLERKLTNAGAQLMGARSIDRGLQRNRRGNVGENDVLVHRAVHFEGLIRVIDPEMLRAAIAQGIGSAKGIGFGLLSVMSAG